MHFAFATRGAIDRVETFIKELSTRYLPFKKYSKETGVLENAHLQMRVCPIQLWDISFPKEHRDLVLNTILRGGKGRPIRDFESWRMKVLDRSINILCKILGLKPLGEYKTDAAMAMQPPDSVEVISIGEKEDYWITEKGEHVDYDHKTPLSWEGI